MGAGSTKVLAATAAPVKSARIGCLCEARPASLEEVELVQCTSSGSDVRSPPN
jgi:hypothetical protein